MSISYVSWGDRVGGGVSNTTITDINKTRMVLLVVVIQLLLLLLSQLL